MLGETLIFIVGTGLRSIAGWFENAFEDGKISTYEWQQLGSTALRILVLSIAAYYGLDFDALQATGVAIGFDYILSKLRSIV